MVIGWRDKALLALVVASGSLGVTTCRQRDARIEAQGEAIAWAQQRDAAVQQARADSLVADLLAQVAAHARAELERTRAVTDSTLRAKDRTIVQIREERTQAVREAIREAGEDSTVVREALDAQAASYEAELSERQDQINVLHAEMVRHEQTIYAMEDGWDALDQALQAERVVRRALEAEVDALRRSGPNWLDSTPVKVLTHVGAFAVGWAVGR